MSGLPALGGPRWLLSDFRWNRAWVSQEITPRPLPDGIVSFDEIQLYWSICCSSSFLLEHHPSHNKTVRTGLAYPFLTYSRDFQLISRYKSKVLSPMLVLVKTKLRIIWQYYFSDSPVWCALHAYGGDHSWMILNDRQMSGTFIQYMIATREVDKSWYPHYWNTVGR